MGGELSADVVSELVLNLYAAALEPELWSSAVTNIADAIDAQSSHLMLVDQATGHDALGLVLRQDPAAHTEYIEKFYAHDLRVPRMGQAVPGRIMRNDDFWSETEKLSSPVYQDYQRVHRLHCITGAQLGIQGHHSWLGFARETETPFVGSDLKTLELIMPHARQALRIARLLGAFSSRQALLDELWSAQGRGIVILAPSGRLTYVNRVAEMMSDERTIRLAGGRISLGSAKLNAVLNRHLASVRLGVIDDDAPASALLEDAHGNQIGLRFFPILSGDGSVLILYFTPLVLSQKPNRDEIAHFARLFMLTPIEEKVLAVIVHGEDLAAHAHARGITLDTARKQVKQVLSKTNCRSQKDIIRLVERFSFSYSR